MLIKFEEEDRKNESIEEGIKENIQSSEIVVDLDQQEKNEVLNQIVGENQKIGLYEPPFDNPLISEEKVVEQSNEKVSEVKSSIQENEEKKIDIDEISKEAGKLEAELMKKVFVPSEEFLQQLDQELKKIEKNKKDKIVEEVSPQKTKKVLSYTRRDA